MKTNSCFILSSKCMLLLFVFFQSCSSGGDLSKDLSEGYFYRSEGSEIHDILCEKAGGGEIPANVISYDFNDDFIIAKQKPKTPQDPLYDKEYQYKEGNDQFYYWIIIHAQDLVIGPIDSLEFESKRNQYRLPKELKLN